MIRVLIVDDSATTRQALAAILQSDPEIKVIGQAVDGLDAIDLTARLAPDVITMDVNMPRTDGNEATRVIMAQMPTPILVVTSLSREALAFEGFSILLSGALDIVRKPSASNEQGFDAIAAEIISKVKAVSQIAVKRKTAA